MTAAHALRVVQEEPPKTRGDCQSGPRPCPYASCRYHLEPDTDTDTCALDVADRGGDMSYGEIAQLLNMTREGVRQVEARALRKILNNTDPEVASASRLLKVMWGEM